jgi:hypothetical protein
LAPAIGAAPLVVVHARVIAVPPIGTAGIDGLSIKPRAIVSVAVVVEIVIVVMPGIAVIDMLTVVLFVIVLVLISIPLSKTRLVDRTVTTARLVVMLATAGSRELH